MRPATRWLAPTILVGFGVFGGCGGTSDGGSGAGGDDAGSAGSSGAAGASHGGASTGGDGSAGESNQSECAKADCGPQLGLPNWTCADGSVGGPTGRCIKQSTGMCGWEINDCPMAGEGGASNQGGEASVAGTPAAAGAPGEDCGGCPSGEVCVYQVGGPGPSRFVCATQNPCGAAGACACIVGQGMCQPNLMGDPPRYCFCDNGLD